MEKSYKELIELLLSQDKKLEGLYGDLSKRLSRILYVHQDKINKDKKLPFFIEREIKKVLILFQRRLYLLISLGMQNALFLAARSLERLLRSLPLSKQVKESYLKPLAKSPYERPSALKTESTRFSLGASESSRGQVRASSLKLSERVWKISEQNKALIEMILKQGIEKGKSASSLARELKAYLKEPDKLFRRLRNGDKGLKPSQAARNYKPTAGVYRSSYQNALRLARTQINRAYRKEENQRWQAMPFVLGFEVKRSKNAPGECICDALAGAYPKEFIFSGWHPNCLCQALPLLMQEKEFLAYAKGKAINKENYIQDIPPGAKAWLNKHKERIRFYKTEPLFIRENFLWDEKEKTYRLRKK